jgi:hypothetical protein
MSDQTQIQPDFGYILNQPASDEKPPQKRDKKLLLIFGLVGTLMVVAVLAVVVKLAPKKANVPVASQSSAIQMRGKQYFGYMSNNQVNEAYTLLDSTTQSEIAKEDFAHNVVATFNNSIDLASCSVSGELTASSTVATQKYGCNTRDGKYQVLFTIHFVVSNNEYKIRYYDIGAQPRTS